MAPLIHVLSLARPAVPLTLVICCCITAQHEPMGVNLGRSVLPVATQVAWKMPFCHSHRNSKRMLPPASPLLCLSWLRLYLKGDETGAASVTLTWETFYALQV